MGKYVIDDHLGKIGEIFLQSGMTLKVSKGGTSVEGPCDFVFGKLYIYPETGDRAALVNIGEEVEVLSEQRNMQELQRRKDAIVHRQLDWRDQMGEETRSFDPSNEGW